MHFESTHDECSYYMSLGAYNFIQTSCLWINTTRATSLRSSTISQLLYDIIISLISVLFYVLRMHSVLHHRNPVLSNLLSCLLVYQIFLLGSILTFDSPMNKSPLRHHFGTLSSNLVNIFPLLYISLFVFVQVYPLRLFFTRITAEPSTTNCSNHLCKRCAKW